jgi:O-antigen biosynthesis protein
MNLSESHHPQRIVPPYPWVGHIPFAMWLIEQFRPKVVVELGVHTGNSFFAMCESALKCNYNVQLHALDTWLGEKHAGIYDESVWIDVSTYTQQNYPTIAKLHRGYFDDSVTKFENQSIDLLHIDGLHTYEAVKHDFETWFPKLSHRAIVLFHDTQVKADDFGVYQFWDEVRKRYPNFEFTHSHGLGVLAVGKEAGQFVEAFSTKSIDGAPAFNDYFALAGNYLVSTSQPTLGHDPDKGVMLTVYYRYETDTAFSEEQTKKFFLPFDVPSTFEIDFSELSLSTEKGNIVELRIDPASQPCNIELHAFELSSALDLKVWELTRASQIGDIGEMWVIDSYLRTGVRLHFVCHDNDPKMVINFKANDITHASDYRVKGKVTALRVDSPAVVSALLANERNAKECAKQKLSQELDNHIASLKLQVSSLNTQLVEKEQELLKQRSGFEAIQNSLQVAQSLTFDQQKSFAEQLGKLVSIVEATEFQRTSLSNRLDLATSQIHQITSSKSWYLTKPLRAIRSSASIVKSPSVRKYASDTARSTWRSIPLPTHAKVNLKQTLFRYFPMLFSHTLAYKNWQQFSASAITTRDVKNESNSIVVHAGDTGYVPLLKGFAVTERPVKLICFYLPQFHPIPENNQWWGDGFTEWTNVEPTYPQFHGHFQPHVPGELGYYNLLDSKVQHRQIELAKLYGIEGFCFYFYWFDGKRLLESPIENYLKDKTLDLPFCLCWANENWSRRWDGLDSEMLIEQNHSPKDDHDFIAYIAKYLHDGRYIKVSGKPLLVVYRPHLLPSAKETTDRWREWCRNNGVGEIYLAYTQSFEIVDPRDYGFDAAIEFPPNNSQPPDLTNNLPIAHDGFKGKAFDWRIFESRSQAYARQDYKLFRSVCPSWDNTARRKSTGTTFLNNTPAGYERWLKNAIAETNRAFINPQERLVFINAWNEWAEGAHLEPDTRHGYAWLQATRNALTNETFVPSKRHKIIVVAHDAYPHGAQFLALHLAKELNDHCQFDVALICLGDGPLKNDYAQWAQLHDLTGKNPIGVEANDLAKHLFEQGFRRAIVNTTVSGAYIETLAQNNIESIALIHELKGVLDKNNLHEQAKSLVKYAKRLVFPAREVAMSFNEVARFDEKSMTLRPQGLFKMSYKESNRSNDRIELRKMLGLEADCQIVLALAYADHRKGTDLFVESGLELAPRFPKLRWVWVGHWDAQMKQIVDEKLAEQTAYKDIFVFPGLQKNIDIFYGGADIFALTSREDPFPSVVLDALDAKLPVVGFQGAGGFTALLDQGCGVTVPMENTHEFANAVAHLIENTDASIRMGMTGSEIIRQRYSFRSYVAELLEMLDFHLPKVSVVVPNFNYAQYLPERLQSILNQDFPIYELIFLDDCSSDDSVEIAERLLQNSKVNFKIVTNEVNSGSVFKQWQKGVAMATGSHVWIAEADDSCEPGMLSELVQAYDTPGVCLSYCESQQTDESGRKLADNYFSYVSDVDSRRWQSNFSLSGDKAIANLLSVKNTIPNVSGVLFDKNLLSDVLTKHISELCTYRIAGDWFVYVHLLKQGRLSFSSKALNKHRRHSKGLTISGINESQLEEIKRVQEIAQKLVTKDDSTKDKANAYLKRLRTEHNIAH